MFLFTTPRSAAPQAPNVPPAAQPVAPSLKAAADKTGTSFEYLARTAERESGFDPRAKAPTSSATGLFQFIDQTWLGMVKSEGAKFGLAQEADAIALAPGGRYTVADPDTRARILALREDPTVASMMAGAFTQKNRAQLASNLGRNPSDGELYMAHFLGAGGARDLIRLAEAEPQKAAAATFPDAAEANRPIFFDKSGRARSAAEVYQALLASHGTQSTVKDLPQAPTDNSGWTAFRAKADAKPMHGLFRSEGGEAVAPAVARLWAPRPGEAAAPATRLSFFPRASGPDVAVETTAPATTQAPVRRADVPLPPVRPPDLGGQTGRPEARVARAAPLDLTSFPRTNRAAP
jgi:hypothetical protein